MKHLVQVSLAIMANRVSTVLCRRTILKIAYQTESAQRTQHRTANIKVTT